MILWKAATYGSLQVAEFTLPAEPLEPGDLPKIGLPEGLDMKRPVSFSGSGPTWLYAYLAHLAHPFLAVCVYDPRRGHIVVQSHSRQYRVGQIISG